MMAKRNLQRERERRKALARQQRMIAKAKRRRRNQLIAGVTVAVVAVGGLAAVIIASVASGRNDNPVAAPSDTGALYSPETDPADASIEPGSGKATYTAVPDQSLAEGREWTGMLQTSIGEIAFTLDGAAAPQAVANFIQLARDGYYDGSSCHRLTTEGIFVLQCGSLTGDGTDGPGYQFGPLENVPEDDVFPPGTIAMARAAAEDSQGSQFFITYQESTIPGGYSVFGHVTSGLEAVEGVAASGTEDGGSDGRPAIAVTIDGIELQ